MDIKCERCGTEYEFDDTRVTEEGVTVKCSTCGHLFKVRKKSFVLTEPVPQEGGAREEDVERNWMVRRPDGTVLTFKELTTLQKWIVERQVTRDDEISKSGETWKRLGSIAELASFFQVVDQASQTAMPAMSQPPPATQPFFQAAAAPAPEPGPASWSQAAVPAQPMSAPPSQPVLPVQPMPAPPSQPAMPVQPMSAPPSQPAMPAQPMSAPPSQPVLPAQPAPQPAGQSEPDSWGDSGVLAGSEDDVVEKWKKRGRRKWFFIVPLFLIAAGVGAFYLLAPEKFMSVYQQLLGKTEPAIPELARTQYQSGLRHYLLDSEAELALAIKDLDSASKEAKGRYPEAMGVLAEAYVSRAERLGDKLAGILAEVKAIDAELAGLKPKEGQKPAAKEAEQIAALEEKKAQLIKAAAPLQAQAKKDMEDAKRQIDAAREVDPKALSAKRALANYLRVQGADRAQIEVPLREAEAVAKDDPGLLFVDGASFASDPASLDTAAQKLNRAIELQAKAGRPDLLRARYALARVLIAQKRQDEAKAQLDRILQVCPGHSAAGALLASLAPPPPPEIKEPDKDEGKKDEGKKDDPPDAGPPKPPSYDSLMSQADRLQQAGRSMPALKAYESALELKPGDVEAQTGKGLCLLDMGNNAGAVASFQKALQVNPRYGDAIIGLAEAYKYKHDNANAIKYYKRYLDVLPSGPEASVARSNLEQLK